MGDLFFDRIVAIGSGVLGMLLLVSAAMHLREPLSGVAVATAPRVVEAPQPSAAAGGVDAASHRTAATVNAAPSVGLLVADAPLAALPAVARVHIVAWPSEAPAVAPVRRFVERRSTRIVPASIRTRHRPEAPPTRVASQHASTVPLKPALRAEHLRKQPSNRPVLRVAGISAAPLSVAARHGDAAKGLGKRASLLAEKVAMLAQKPFLFAKKVSVRADRWAALTKSPVTVAKKTATFVAMRTSRRNPLVALRAAAKTKARFRKRLAVAPLPEPPVGYDPKTNVVPQVIDDATTASSIAADPSDANRPSVIILRNGR